MRPALESLNHSSRAGLAAHRLYGPFEAHRLTLDEMKDTTIPQLKKKLEDRWAKV